MTPNKKIILITGAAGFIGSSIAQKLLSENYHVIGIDNINGYYNPFLKQKRIKNIEQIDQNNCWRFLRVNLENSIKIYQIFTVDHPVSLYAATKKSNELLAHSYSHLFQIPMTGLRFFTVYGPMGRPDMAPMIFADAMLRGKSINVFNNGNMSRDFTYIDDVTDAIYKCFLKKPASNSNFYKNDPEPSTSFAPHRVFNVGSNNPTNLLDFIKLLESSLGVKALKKMRPMQPGDIQSTFADIKRFKNWVNFSPKTSLDSGIMKFASWYKEYFNSSYYR